MVVCDGRLQNTVSRATRRTVYQSTVNPRPHIPHTIPLHYHTIRYDIILYDTTIRYTHYYCATYESIQHVWRKACAVREKLRWKTEATRDATLRRISRVKSPFSYIQIMYPHNRFIMHHVFVFHSTFSSRIHYL